MKIPCKYCGKEFDKTPGNRKYCSDECLRLYKVKHQAMYRGVSCPHVKGERTDSQQMYADLFAAGHTPTKVSKQLGVSRQAAQAMWKKLGVGNHREKCTVCGKALDKTHGKQKYCSALCKKSAYLRECPICGTEFRTDGRRRFCSMGCAKNHAWKARMEKGIFAIGKTFNQQRYSKLFSSGLSVAEVAKKMGVSWRGAYLMYRKLSL